jgi:KDO2-lipid IV(A) lauroyltransferase
LLSDLEVRRLRGEFVPFLGVPALTVSAPAALARAAGVPLLPAVCVFDALEGRWRLSFEEPLELDRGLPRLEARRELLARQNEVFGRWIRAHPEQWAWHQPRWRTRPEGSAEGDLYKALMKV